ncbi:hypothetical protein [Streptomyces beigongshangae]|uniref:hypothetical protein n=1 Tax=Streptomyces beigongshangae TaxID=2841597 RepID=UPI001C854728|nr:hypothetical protein [Streptomyces sp. REN17]
MNHRPAPWTAAARPREPPGCPRDSPGRPEEPEEFEEFEESGEAARPEVATG